MSVNKFISVFLVLSILCSTSLCFNFGTQVFAADDVSIIADSVVVGEELTGSYADATTFQWYYCDAYDGEYTPISGATEDTYIISENDIGGYIRFSADNVMSEDYICVGNVAYAKSKIYSNTEYNESTLSAAFDGNIQTYTELDVAETEAEYYIYVDLESSYLVNQVKLQLKANRVNCYFIELSNDAESWNRVYYQEMDDYVNGMEITFPGANSRYVKIGFKLAAVRPVKFTEIEILSARLPEIADLSIQGSEIVGDKLTAVFTPENGATEEDCKVNWYRYENPSDDSDNEWIGEGSEYEIKLDDVGKYIRCFVAPKSANGVEGDVVKSSFTDVIPFPVLPSVSEYSIKGEAIVGSALEAVFTPENGATIENTFVEWYRYSSATEDSSKEPVGTGRFYTLTAADEGKYMRCHITPKNTESDEGEVAKTDFTSEVREPMRPEIYSAYIEGNALIGETVQAMFAYDGDIDEEQTTYQWYCITSNLTFVQSIDGVVGTEKSLTITSDMKGKYLKCYITPKNSAGVAGTSKYTAVFGAIVDENENTTSASTVGVTGKNAEVGSVLTGVYTYIDTTGIPEGESKYFWYRSEDGNNYKRIDGAGSRTYTITENDEGCYVKFGVQVHNRDSKASGSIVISDEYVAVGNLAYRAEIFGSSSIYRDAPAYFILDGHPDTLATTYGLDEEKLPYFVTIDLGKEKFVSDVACFINSKSGATTGVAVKVSSDGSEWIEAYSDSEPMKIGKNIYVLNRPYKTRYVRFEIVGPKTNIKINEFEVYYHPNTISPVLKLEGNNPEFVPVGSQYVEPGFTATDDEKGDISDRVIIEGNSIDTSSIGEYEITYTVEDDYGNTAVEKRKVIVVSGIQADGDFAYGKKVTASSQTSGAEANCAVDGNPNTYWSPQIEETNSTIIIDLESEQWISSMKLNANLTNASYSLYSSDNLSSWTKICDVSSEKLLDFSPVKKRYFKLEITKTGSFMLNDFELRLNDKGKAIVAANEISFGANLNALTEDLALADKGLFGCDILWTTSDSNTITKDGSITRSKTQDKNAVLTAVVSFNGQSHTVSFDITVLKDSSGSQGSSGSGGNLVKTPNIGSGNSVTIGGAVQNSVPKNTFSDLESVPWAKDYIENLAAKGIVEGIGNNKFSPDSVVTREQFVKMIITAFELFDDSADAEFNDVEKSDWYYRYVASAVKNGIINGVSVDSFGAGKSISRQDMCVIVERAAKASNISISTGIQNSRFEDEQEIAEYARNAVNLLKSANIVNGMDNNTFAPNSYLTRAQAAKVICLLSEKVG